MKETLKRSIAKTITYRINVIITLTFVTYWITGNLMEMTTIVIIFNVIQTFFYYYHERLWERVKWGYS